MRGKLRRIIPRITRVMREMEQDAEMGQLGVQEIKLEIKARELRRSYFATQDEASKASIRKEMETLAGQLFDVRHARGKKHIEQLEQRLQNMRQRLEEAEKNRAQLIKEKLDKALDPQQRPRLGQAEEDDFGGGDPQGRPEPRRLRPQKGRKGWQP